MSLLFQPELECGPRLRAIGTQPEPIDVPGSEFVLVPFAGRYRVRSKSDLERAAQLSSLIRDEPAAFDRGTRPGHVTASAFIVDEARDHVLLTHHAKLDAWLPLGGHCDGIRDAHFVALKEAYEESGLRYLSAVTRDIFDIDIHEIPGTAREPTHLHFDVRYLFEADRSERLVVSAESKALRWVRVNDLEDYSTRDSVLVLKTKLRCL